MKYSLLLVFLMFVSVSAFGQKERREIDLKINGIGFGSSYSAVIKKLGKPLQNTTQKADASQSCSGKNETHSRLVYDGLEIMLLRVGKERDSRIYRIEVTSPQWTASGIKIGANAGEVKNNFGEPDSEENESDQTVLYYVMKGNSGWINFHVKDNKVVKILLNETLC
jgi:hypothetical protein